MSVLYFAIKFVAYAAWCRLGIRVLQRITERPMRLAAALGLFRLAVGFILGWGLIFVMLKVFPDQGRIGFQIPQYVIALILLRWIEWTVISAWLRRAPASRFFAGKSASDYFWRAGGVGLSFLTDASVLFGVGVAGIIPC